MLRAPLSKPPKSKTPRKSGKSGQSGSSPFRRRAPRGVCKSGRVATSSSFVVASASSRVAISPPPLRRCESRCPRPRRSRGVCESGRGNLVGRKFLFCPFPLCRRSQFPVGTGEGWDGVSSIEGQRAQERVAYPNPHPFPHQRHAIVKASLCSATPLPMPHHSAQTQPRYSYSCPGLVREAEGAVRKVICGEDTGSSFRVYKKGENCVEMVWGWWEIGLGRIE